MTGIWDGKAKLLNGTINFSSKSIWLEQEAKSNGVRFNKNKYKVIHLEAKKTKWPNTCGKAQGF